jgi:hypothetical protein
VQWGQLSEVLEHEGGCTLSELEEWLDDPMLVAVVVQQHQSVFHPKIVSLPLGHVKERTADFFEQVMTWKRKKSYPAKVRLLLINNSCDSHRRGLTAAIETKLAASADGLYFNSYGLLSGDQFATAVASSKFVLCPSGLGWDSYRVWEVLLFGSIPVIEHSPGWNVTRAGAGDKDVRGKDTSGGYGWDRTFDDLPVLWVRDFSELSVEMLEEGYADIMARHSAYDYSKLTQDYWGDLLLRIAREAK